MHIQPDVADTSKKHIQPNPYRGKLNLEGTGFLGEVCSHFSDVNWINSQLTVALKRAGTTEKEFCLI